jgi:putative hydrolase of the HAD superfamily
MTFLFDIGRVLLDFDFESSLSRLFPAGTGDGPARLSRLLERKDEFETGKIPVDSYITWALQVLGSDATPTEFRHAWQQIFTPNAPMWRCVRQLAADGHQLILFSNINGIHWPWITENFPEFAYFHAAVVSFETGAIKPQREIYQYAIHQHRLVPADTLYIDDLPQNIATGRELGFRCWQYDLNDHASFETWLASNLKSEI